MDQGLATILAALITASAAIGVALITQRRKHQDVARSPAGPPPTGPLPAGPPPAGLNESNRRPAPGWWLYATWMLLFVINLGVGAVVGASEQSDAFGYALVLSVPVGLIVGGMASLLLDAGSGTLATLIAIFYFFLLIEIREPARAAGLNQWEDIWWIGTKVLFLGMASSLVFMLVKVFREGK